VLRPHAFAARDHAPQSAAGFGLNMERNGGQGRNCSALHAFRNSSKRHFVGSKIRSNHLSCKMLGIHGASWHFLTLLALVSPETIGVSPFPRRIANIFIRSIHKPCTGIGEGFAGRVREARRCASRKIFWHLVEWGVIAEQG
jgi:hypothetical protein